MIKIQSDTHFDFHLDSSVKINSKKLRAKFPEYFETEATSLIISGDIGHHCTQNVEIFNIIRKETNIRDILVTFGNHEYYNVSNSQKYSFRNIQQKEEYLINRYKEAGIHILNGNMNDVVELEGKRIWGFPSWYDDCYYNKATTTSVSSIDSYWRQTMNDSRLIPSLVSFYDMIEFQNSKIKEIPENIDIMVTHVRPFISDDFMDERYIGDKSNTFYMFDGLDLIEKVNPKIWIYGHTHTFLKYNKFGVEFICNPIGYPGEKNERKEILI